MERAGTTRRSAWLERAPWAAVVGVLCLVAAAWYVVRAAEYRHLERMTSVASRLTGTLIQQDLTARVEALARMASRWEESGGTPEPNWRADVDNYVADQPGYRFIALTDPALALRWLEPPTDGDVDRLFAVVSSPQGIEAAWEARAGRRTVLAAPLAAASGEPGFATYIPLYLGTEFAGLLIAFTEIEPWLTGLLTPVLRTAFGLSVSVGGTPVFRLWQDEEPVDVSRYGEQVLSTHGVEWSLQVSPARDHLPPVYARSSTLVLAAGLLLSVLVAWTVYLARQNYWKTLALAHSEARLATLLESLPGMVFRWENSPKWPAEFVSAGCLALSGYPKQAFEAGERFWGELIHPEDRESLRESVRQAERTGSRFDCEFRITSREGEEKWMWCRGRVDRATGSEVGFLEGVVIEITARKAAIAARAEAESETRRLRDSLAHMDRLTMLGEMATGIAHEINQPLSSISMYAQSAIRFLNRTPVAREEISTILDKLSGQTRRAAAIIERMQMLRGQPEARFEDADSNLLITDVAKLAATESHIRGIEIIIDSNPESCTCRCVGIQIQQVVLNLLRNAMTAMTAIECRNGHRIYLTTRLDDGGFTVSVADSGTGISEEMASDLFRPFSSEHGSDIGLGLPICMSIISAHRGEMGFYNNELGGATFYFTLPCAESTRS